MTTCQDVLAEPLAECLDDIVIELPRHRARVLGRTITAESTRQLRQRIAGELYRRLHIGHSAADDSGVLARRDPTVERELAAALPRRTHEIDSSVLAIDPERDTVLVDRDGIAVWAPRATVSCGSDVRPGDTVRVTVGTARPALSPGFFLVGAPLPAGPVLRVYVHLSARHALVPAWTDVLRVIDGTGLPYQAKVCSAPSQLPRQDGLVVYADARGTAMVTDLARAVADVDGLGETTSVFASAVGRGVSVAWEPEDARPGMPGLSFGHHRAVAVATGLVAHAADPDRDRLTVVADALVEANIDPAQPARNRTSPRLPTVRPATVHSVGSG
jgi:hypothetical protein